MGENSVIVEGVDSAEAKMISYSTIHGAGRVLGRRKAAGKSKFKGGKRIRISDGLISKDMMLEWVNSARVELRGAGTDESPHCYKRLPEVLKFHENSIKVVHTLRPIGVAMAGEDIFDPFKD